MIAERDSSTDSLTFELVRILHKTKLIFDHDYDPLNNYSFNTDLLAQHFNPNDCNTYHRAYSILKTMSFKVKPSLHPYSPLTSQSTIG